MSYIYTKFPSTSTDLHHQRTSVCMPSLYLVFSCSRSQAVLTLAIRTPVPVSVLRVHLWSLHTGGNLMVLHRGCRLDGLTLSIQFLRWLAVVSNLCAALHFHAQGGILLDISEVELLCNASWVPSASWCRLRRWLSPLSASRPTESVLHRLRRQWWWSCPLVKTDFLPCRLRMVSFKGLPFYSSSKRWTQVSSVVTPGYKTVFFSAS